MFKNTGKHPLELLMPLQFYDCIFLINLINYTVLKWPELKIGPCLHKSIDDKRRGFMILSISGFHEDRQSKYHKKRKR